MTDARDRTHDRPELATLLELTTDLVCSMTLDGRLLYLNPGGRALLGWPPEEPLDDKRIADLHPAWAMERFGGEALPAALAQGTWYGESALLTRGGEEIPVSQVLVAHRDADGEPSYVSTILRDIRERKEVEARLRASTEMFQLVMDYIPQYVFWKDRHSVYRGCNANFARVAGVESPAAIVGKTDHELAWKKEEAEFFREVDQRVMGSDSPELHIIEPQLQADGKEAWLDTSKIPLHDESGRVVGILGTFEDITARKEAENALVDREEKLRIILDSIGDAVIATDAEGVVTRMNPVAETLTGWPRDEAVGRHSSVVLSIRPESDVAGEALADPFETLLRAGRLGKPGEPLRLVRRDGEERWVSERGAPMRNQEGELIGLVVVFRDVTEQRALEEQLRHARKMESVGRLAGGVAHDFNNMLAAISGFAELVKRRAGDPEVHRFAEQILDVSENAAALTQKLLDFSRKGVHHRRVYDVHAVIESVRGLLERTIDRRIEIEMALNASVHHAVGDPAQLQNALLNLGLNARDAMPEGGTITIGTADAHLDAAACLRSGFELAPGAYLSLTFSDTGVGMDEDVLGRAFEPYFTTKGPGAGTGLGLPSVYNAVLDHRGAIRANSRPGRGTELRLLLPARDARDDQVEEGAAETVHGEGCVVVVDDEPGVRKAAGQMLRALGYEVLTFADGAAALEHLRKEPGSVDLALLDMVMPGLGGREVGRALRALDPELPIVFTSGYTRDDDGDSADAAECFLKKPYRLSELAQVVSRALGRDEPPA